ncbi:MAG TPA: RT0821/Lpp0805 family surface protein [Pseudolabrys sp.]|nr:RT0821/Lpp0805 family surface protein [Pseudolabrys sp.]
MAGAVKDRRLYSGCAPGRLWHGLGAAAALAVAVALGGCSMSYQLDSFFGGGDNEPTGSITPRPATKQAAELPPDGDLVYARAAAREVLTRNEKDASLPWANPRSGARGTVTPLASAYNQDGQTCRNFLASYVKGADEAWLQGEACKEARGAWEVRSLKPWKRS